jgi:hypothetical protein
MSWRQRLADAIAPRVKQVEEEAVAAVQKRTGLSVRLVLFLLALTLLLGGVGGYAIYWRFIRPEKPNATLVPAQTQGGEKAPGYMAPEVKKLSGLPKRETVRSVQSTPVEDLPEKERGYAPVVAPAVGADCVVRTVPELLTSSVVPPHRGETEVRTWLNPDGSAQNILTPLREDFFGWPWKNGNWKKLELEAGYGVGGKQVDASGAWWPVRVGNFHLGAKAEGWIEPTGGMKGAGSIRVRWEPFR